MSLLRTNGHVEPEAYPLGYLWDEATLVRNQLNSFLATNAILTQMAVSCLFSKTGQKEFSKIIKGMTEDG